MRHRTIGICGSRGSGKNVTADMLRFLYNTPAWCHHYWIYKTVGHIIGKRGYKVTSFAAPLKRCLAGMLNVDVKQFENRSFKEQTFICLDTGVVTKYPSSVLSDTRFNTALKNGNYDIVTGNFITIRQLMQFTGTEVMQNAFGKNIWVNFTLADNVTPLIISDLRLKPELEAIKERDGYTICLLRDGCKTSKHISDQQMGEMIKEGKFDLLIDNNGSIKELFDKLKKI